jgi:hypothetical protein
MESHVPSTFLRCLYSAIGRPLVRSFRRTTCDLTLHATRISAACLSNIARSIVGLSLQLPVLILYILGKNCNRLQGMSARVPPRGSRHFKFAHRDSHETPTTRYRPEKAGSNIPCRGPTVKWSPRRGSRAVLGSNPIYALHRF